jgi:hypothetical protein
MAGRLVINLRSYSATGYVGWPRLPVNLLGHSGIETRYMHCHVDYVKHACFDM